VIEKNWSPPFVVIKNFCLTLDCEGVLDGDQRISITIEHTHTIRWQSKFFGHPRGKMKDEKKHFPKIITQAPTLFND